MWNYSFMLPTLLVLTTLLSFYFSQPRLPVRLNGTFIKLLTAEVFVVLADLLSSMADENYEMFSPGVLYLLNTLFFVLFLARIIWFFRFTVDVLRLDERSRPALTVLTRLLFYVGEIMCATSFLTGLVFRIEDGAYRSGPMYNIIYVCFFFYLFLSLALLAANRRRLKPREFFCAVSYNLVLIAGNIVRILLPRYLVMNTFCLVAIVIIYLAFLNPDIYMSDRGFAFNMRAFRDMLGELVHRKDYRVLAFAIRNYMHERGILGGDQMDRAIEEISQYLAKAYPGYVPFYLRSGRFAMVSSSATPCTDVRQSILTRFQQPWRINNVDIALGITFAFVNSECGLNSADRIINNLFIALEPAENSDAVAAGDGVDVIDPEGIQHIDQQVDIMRLLDQALEHNRVEVFLQPVFDSRTRKMVAAEALARIRDANGHIIPPDMFIPIAEKGGYINRLGDQVLEKVCVFIKRHDMDGMGLKWINVNLSPLQCMRRDLPERFAEILQRHQVPVERIHLEITEQSMIDYSMVQRQVQSLQKDGFLFVLDDYGSGYSNLTRIKHYPFINIKLDMEVVWDYFRDPDSLLPTILQGFKRMNLTITAEGIESLEMADALTAIGSDFLQGFYFSKPLPMKEFEEKYAPSAK